MTGQFLLVTLVVAAIALIVAIVAVVILIAHEIATRDFGKAPDVTPGSPKTPRPMPPLR